MTRDEVKAIDAAWFKKHRGTAQVLRHAYGVERQQAIAVDPAFAGLILVLITQTSPGRMHRQMICALDDKVAGYILRNGLDCIGIREGQLCIPISGPVVRLQ
jgi:hypothetical protein